MMRGALRNLNLHSRPPLRIEPTIWRIRTLHPPRRVAAAGERPPFTLDGIVKVSLARLGGLGEQGRAS